MQALQAWRMRLGLALPGSLQALRMPLEEVMQLQALLASCKKLMLQA